MLNLGTVKPGSTIRIPFTTFDKDDGSAITMTNYAAADILVYKDGSTTERASTAGFTATTDFDTKTGKHLAIIDLADNTTSGFWNAGSEYLVAIDAVTVDAVTTGGWIARFTIGYPNAILDTTIATLSTQTSFTLTAGPAEDDALNGFWAIIHDIASAVQHSKVLISDYVGSTKTVTLAAGATFTAAAGDNISVISLAPLQVTVPGRTLDVTDTGEAGIDWANIGAPTTTVALTNTTVATATNLTNLPATAATAVGQNRILDRVEFQRGHHTVTGSTYYVDGIGGNDTTGNGTRATPYKTISKALTVCTSNAHDEIILLPNSGGGPTTITESAAISITKNYVMIRGPGRDCIVTRSNNGDIFDVQANGVELSGFRVNTFGGSTSNGITISGGKDFVRLHYLWLENIHQDAVYFNVANNCEIYNCTILAPGRDGVRVASGGGSGASNNIIDSVIRDAVGSAINLQGADASESRIQRNTIRDNAVGITIASGTTDTVITDNRMINNSTTISDSGTRTLQAWNFLSTDTSGNISGSVASVTGLTASDVGAIKTQTDKFVFTVTNQVDANIQSINDTTIVGNGVSPKFGA